MVSGESRVQISGKGDRPEASGLPQCNNPVYWSADLIGTPLTYFLNFNKTCLTIGWR
jgi:hypothetical protein